MDMRVTRFLLLLPYLLLLHRHRTAQAQQGFESVICCGTSNTTDPTTPEILWTSDDHLFDGIGKCKNISLPSGCSTTARIFSGTGHENRWCYNLATAAGQEYLTRATFLHGPILRSSPNTSFEISIGATPISQVNSSLDAQAVEGVFRATGDHTSLCLAAARGNAYVSSVELRPLTGAGYQGSHSPTAILKLVSRVDLGGDRFSAYRYPVDPSDRIWGFDPGFGATGVVLRSADVSVVGANSTVPLQVLRTAVEDSEKLVFLHPHLETGNASYAIFLYFLELDPRVQAGQRVFDVYVNGDKEAANFDILGGEGKGSNYKEARLEVYAVGFLNISLVKASDSVKYGPICNAYEIFHVHPRAAETLQSDVDAAMRLRHELLRENPGVGLLGKWSGDPCLSSSWEGMLCEQKNGTLVITKLDLSAMSLQGPFPTSISGLTELLELDVQKNNFSGPIPKSLASLRHLKELSIGCNPYLGHQLPPGLSDKLNLTIEFGQCRIQDPSGSKSFHFSSFHVGSAAGGSVMFTAAFGLFFTCFSKRRKRHPDGKESRMMKNSIYKIRTSCNTNPSTVVQAFSLQYIEKATSNYKTIIGEGGFGAVFRGTLSYGQDVAVKVRSTSSTQGIREFNNEVSLLSAIQHENLVPLLGYCSEDEQQILVYPFMSNGSLQDRLYGEAAKRKALDWPTRLSIALGAARGLMYLHSFAGRCIIHRDVKSSNILLDDSMCAKVADFGFSKYAPQEGDSAASLEVRGTAGYLDPEYYSTQKLSDKSDVFSFGVVLLEIISGREPLNIHRPRNEWSLVEWAKQFIRESRIEEIVDPSIKAGYHAEAMWRVVEAASTCIEPYSIYRPSMADVVRELEDALIIENNASEYMRSIDSLGNSNCFVSIERKMLAPIPTMTETPPPLPR